MTVDCIKKRRLAICAQKWRVRACACPPPFFSFVSAFVGWFAKGDNDESLEIGERVHSRKLFEFEWITLEECVPRNRVGKTWNEGTQREKDMANCRKTVLKCHSYDMEKCMHSNDTIFGTQIQRKQREKRRQE